MARRRRYEPQSAHSRISISAIISVIMADDDRLEYEREDMLSILREFRPYYFWILTVQIVVWGVVVFLSERGNCAELGLAGCAVAIGLKMSGLVPLMLFTSVILVDLGRYLMVLLRSSREKIIAKAKARAEAEGRAAGRAEGRAAGRAAGRAEGANKMYAEWSAWNARRIEHERNGEPFDEPPPALADGIEIEDDHQ